MIIKILRGLPGSGKTTWVKECYPDEIVCSADHFFERTNGYHFDPNRIPEAHESCLRKYTEFVTRHPDYPESPRVIIVDNTNISAWEAAPYYSLAKAFWHHVEIVNFSTPFKTCLKRNVHNVPKATMIGMAQRLEKEVLPNRWEVNSV